MKTFNMINSQIGGGGALLFIDAMYRPLPLPKFLSHLAL